MADQLDFNMWLLSQYDMDAEEFSKEDKRTRSAIKNEYKEYLTGNHNGDIEEQG